MGLNGQIFTGGNAASVSDISTLLDALSTPGRLAFSSNVQASVALSGSAGDKSLPDVTIPDGAIPPNATISRVLAVISWGKSLEGGSVTNALDGTTYVQVKESVSGSYINAIAMVDNTLSHVADETRGGMAVAGNIDVKAQVSAHNLTFNFQWTSALSDDTLTLYDVQVHLVVEYE